MMTTTVSLAEGFADRASLALDSLPFRLSELAERGLLKEQHVASVILFVQRVEKEADILLDTLPSPGLPKWKTCSGKSMPVASNGKARRERVN